jgi:hypothetical protein
MDLITAFSTLVLYTRVRENGREIPLVGQNHARVWYRFKASIPSGLLADETN